MRRLALLLTIAPGLATAAIAQSEEVVDTYVDGSVRSRYSINGKGERSGAYFRYHRNGRVMIHALFRDGKKWGAYVEYSADGDRKLTCSYKADALDGEHRTYSSLPEGERVVTTTYDMGVKHGPFIVTLAGKTVARQTWSEGQMISRDGMLAFPRRLDELRQRLAAIQAPPPDPIPGTDNDPLLPERLAALRRLQAYRYLCGLSYEDMVLDPTFNDLCDHAARLCKAIGRLDHTPSKPPDMSEEDYRKGYRGTTHSNLSRGQSMLRSVDGYMDDSDPSNIDRVGHRRWCLNPAMQKTGFGIADRFSAMWSFDSSGSGLSGKDGGKDGKGSWVHELGAVLYPPPGYVPVDFFGPEHAWSISILRGRQATKDAARIEVVALDELYLQRGKPLRLDHLVATTQGAGIGNCLIFRPTGLVVEPGQRYLCTVSIDGGKTTAYQYVVEFVET